MFAVKLFQLKFSVESMREVNWILHMCYHMYILNELSSFIWLHKKMHEIYKMSM